ncbi:hypothetical protein [uncultured Aquimarina sp.]|uniref:hypothetical protein n=1 Tax=uncultured Aquimarina sp. TaxID=575652 RepID=UPI0026192593|nr:hypothetical protein [uncultured Aquimarina sp.]
MTRGFAIRVIEEDLKNPEKVVSWDEHNRHLVLKDSAKVKLELYQTEPMFSSSDRSVFDGFFWDLWDIEKSTSFNWSKTKNGIKQPSTDRASSTSVTLSVKEGFKSKQGYWIEAFKKTANFETGCSTTDALSMIITFEPPPPTVKATWLNPDGSEITEEKYLGQWVMLKLETTGLNEEQVRVSIWDDRGGDTSLLYSDGHENYSNERITNHNRKKGEEIERWKGKSIHDKLVFPENYDAFQKYNQTIGIDGTLTFLISLSKTWEKYKVMWGDSIELRILVDHPRLEKYAISDVWYGLRPNRYDPNYISEPLQVRLPEPDELAESRPDYAPKTVVIEDSVLMESKGIDPCHYKYIEVSEFNKDKKERTYVAFEEKPLNKPDFEPYEIVTGGNGHRRKVIIDLINSNDKEGTTPKACISENIPKTTSGAEHKNNMLSFNIPKEFIKKVTASDKKSELESFLERQLKKMSTELGYTASVNDVNFKRTNEGQVLDTRIIEVLDHTETKLVFYALYPYNTDAIRLWGIPTPLPFILRYLWTGSIRPHPYSISAQSCRYNRDIVVNTYPNVKWSVYLNLNQADKSKQLGWGNSIRQTKKEKKDAPKGFIKSGDGSWDFGLKVAFNRNKEFSEYSDKTAFSKQDEYDLSAPFKNVIDPIMNNLNDIGGFIKDTVLGKKKDPESDHDQPDSKHQMALEKAKKAAKKKEKEDRIKIKNQPDVQKALDKLQDNEKEIKQLKNKTYPKDKYPSQKALDKQKTEDKEKLLKKYRNRDNLQQNLKKKGKKAGIDINRNLVTFRIIYPSLSFSFEWFLKGTKTTNANITANMGHKVGTVLKGKINASPLIGLEIKLDFLALAQRAHPAVLALIAAADIAMSMIGDGSAITCDLTATGTFGGYLQGEINTLTKENSFNPDTAKSTGAELATLKGNLTIKLEASIKAMKTARVLKHQVILTGAVGVSATASDSVHAKIAADTKGFYMDIKNTFEGLELIGYATAQAEIVKERDLDDEDITLDQLEKNPKKKKLGGKAEFKYRVIDKQKAQDVTKFYFNDN